MLKNVHTASSMVLSCCSQTRAYMIHAETARKEDEFLHQRTNHEMTTQAQSKRRMYLHAAVTVEAGDAEHVLFLAVHREYFPCLDIGQAYRARRRATGGMTRKPERREDV